MTEKYIYIYQASKTAMQSGRALTQKWIAEFPPSEKKSITHDAWRNLPDAIMGWHGGGETKQQLQMSFPSLSSAQDWAKAQGLVAILRPSQNRRVTHKSYASNFAHDRPVPWTH